MSNDPASRMIRIDLAQFGIDPDDPTITGVVDDDELDKLSPRTMVEPSEIVKELYEKAKKDKIDIEMAAPTLARTLSLNKKKVEAKNAIEHENDSHFICTFCFKIVDDPVECETCFTAFCKPCIDGWKKDNRRCPVGRCENFKTGKLHRFVQKMLDEHRFFCPLEGCTYSKAVQIEKIKKSKNKVIFANLGLPYKEALKHQQECDFRLVNCPNRCGCKLYRKDIDEHLPNCLNYVWTCPDCGISEMPNRLPKDREPHDCFKALVEATQYNQKYLADLERDLGVDYKKINIRDNQYRRTTNDVWYNSAYFSNGTLNDKGVSAYWFDGDWNYYIGEMKNDKRHGKGKYVDNDGNGEEQNWENDRRVY